MKEMRWNVNVEHFAPVQACLLPVALFVVFVASVISNPVTAWAQMSADHSNPIGHVPIGSMQPNPQNSLGGQGTLTSKVTSTTFLPSDTLGANDLIEMMVPYCLELSRNFRIGADGVLRLPLLHQGIVVEGRTPDQAAASIKEALVKEEVLADPTVSIAVVEFRSRTVSVTGAVIHPLTFQATGEVTLLDAIAMAGGVTTGVGADVLVTSTHSADGKRERTVLTIPVRTLLAQGSSADNLLLRGGEEIRVTEAGRVFIAGNVNKPGMYVMQGSEDTTVIKALALSQGLQSFTARTAYIYRSGSDGTRKEISVPLSRIISRKART